MRTASLISGFSGHFWLKSVHVQVLIQNLRFTAGQRRSQSPPPGHPAPFHRLARLWGAVLPHRHAEIPQEGQGCEPALRWADCCPLQVRILGLF